MYLTADLLFDLFGFSCFTYVELATDLLVWLDPNQSNRRSAVDSTLILHLWTSLIGGDEGCIAQGVSPRNYAAYAWQHSILVDLWTHLFVHLLLWKSSYKIFSGSVNRSPTIITIKILSKSCILFECWTMKPFIVWAEAGVNLIKQFTIVIYDSRVVQTRKFPILWL